jgi:DnaJ-class molecular chaperone
MPEIETYETCPVCGGRGTRRKRDGIERRDPPDRVRCVACQGEGALRQRRLRDLVLRGIRVSVATKGRSIDA